MRLGAPLAEHPTEPAAWIAELQRAGYRAAYSPVDCDADDAEVAAYVSAAQAADIVIAEVGAWSNPIDPEPVKARAAIRRSQECLDLAERLGARCCVNIVGSRNPDKWDGPHPENFSRETFDLVVESTREIIDAVRPHRTSYALETMPWIFPSSCQEYMELLKAVDRPALGVHLDPVNMINSPARYYRNGDLIRECFDELGSRILSVHAKDVLLRESLTVHLDEVCPGAGGLDYSTFLAEMARLPADTPIMLEHLPAGDYPRAAGYIRGVARDGGIKVD